MSIRKRNDSVKGDRGIDNGKGENFTSNAIDPWTAQSVHEERSYSRNAGSNKGDFFIERGADSQNLLNQREEFQFRAGRRDIFDDVVANDGGSDNGGFSGPVRYGVNRPDGAGKVLGRKDQWPR
jgi:hypothetical protein